MTATPATYGTVDAGVVAELQAALGVGHVRTDEETRVAYGTDALKKGHPADVVVWPGTTDEVAAVLRIGSTHRIPVVPRGAGTGYTGGAVPRHGGIVLSLERFTRILEIDERNLLAVAEAHVVTGDLQRAVRALCAGVVALGGSISGEHGIGFSKLPFVSLELSPAEIALMRRVKAAFDPLHILNPGKMFP